MSDPWKGLLRTGCAAVLAVGPTFGGAAPAAATVPGQDDPAAPAVLFELKEPRASGVLDPGTPVELEIQLTGLTPPGEEDVVAIIEGEPFVRRLVPMRLDEESNAFRLLVTLEPGSPEGPAGREKAVRVRTTIARLQGMLLDHIVTRVVYVTMRLPAEAETVDTASFGQPSRELGLELTEERLQARVPPEEPGGAAFSEEDIIPDPVPAEAQAYWRQVSQRIVRTWRRPDPATRIPEGRPGVGVRFRLHANGEAQLIQIERSSGVPEIDEAGLRAVLQAHPFPPFPPHVRDEAVDLHIELGGPRGGPSTPPGRNSAPEAPASARP